MCFHRSAVPLEEGSRDYPITKNKWTSRNLHDFRLLPRCRWYMCALLGYYAACSGNFLVTFRDNIGPISRVPPFKMGHIGCPETSVTNYHYTLRNIPEERTYQTKFFGHHLTTAACCVRRCHSVLSSTEVSCHTSLFRVTQLRQCCVFRNSRSVWSCQPLPVSSPQFEPKPFIVGQWTMLGMEQLSE
jgi:hypothetical protein